MAINRWKVSKQSTDNAELLKDKRQNNKINETFECAYKL